MPRTSISASIGITLSFLLALSANDTTASPKDDLTEPLNKVLAENVRATGAEDIEAVLATTHPMSPAAVSTRPLLQQVFRAYDLRYEVVSSEFAGVTGEYAMLRVKQKTTKVAGPAFTNNTLDSIQVFRKDGGQWKVWAAAILEVTPTP